MRFLVSIETRQTASGRLTYAFLVDRCVVRRGAVVKPRVKDAKGIGCVCKKKRGSMVRQHFCGCVSTTSEGKR